MIPLNLPAAEIKVVQKDGRAMIFDFLRKRYITLTPEEWVRQNFTYFLVFHKGFPSALLANEVSININGSTRRCDTVLYHREGGIPRLIVEYKAPSVAITQQVFNQISAYNSLLRAEYLIVTNGLSHYCCRLDYQNNSCSFLQDIPNFNDL